MHILNFKFYFHSILKILSILLILFLNTLLFPPQVQSEPLAKGKDKFLGNIIRDNENIPSNFDSYWNQVTPEESGMWGKVEASRDKMQWDELDKIYNYAKEKGFPFREHCLVWGPPLGEPPWLCALSLDEQKKEVEEWIRLFGERYPATDHINVVNNPLRDPPCYKDAIGGDGATGWDWVVWSFEKARQYCPNAKLLLNQYGVLNDWVPNYLEIINLLKERGLIDGIGVEGHFLEDTDLSVISYKLEYLAKSELPIYITGYDVDIANDNAQLQKIQEQFPILWQYPSVRGITLWGYEQGQLWKENTYLIKTDGTERPALKWLRDYLSGKDNTSSISEDTKSHKIFTEKQFEDVNPEEAVKDMFPGWNLGNTLDATPTEGQWNNPPAEEYIFDDIKKAGFKSIRLAVTWQYHIGPAPDYKVDAKWFNRVEQVMDWALERDFWVVLNSHHDSDWLSEMAVDPKTGEYKNNYDNTIVKFEKLWEQIAERFKGKSEKVIFQILNEPLTGVWDVPGGKKHDLTPAQVNDMNERILKIIRSSGGHNKKRFVMIGGPLGDAKETLKFFDLPQDEYIILAVHYYTPYEFLQNRWGKTTWGTEKDKEGVEDIFKRLYEAFVRNHLPVVVTEWGGTSLKIDPLSTWYYHDFVTKTARKYGIPLFLWDDGALAYFDRKSRIWRDKILKDATMNASKGISNSFIFPVDNYFRVNAPPEDLKIKLELNGNKLVNVYNEKDKHVNQYCVLDSENSTITVKKEYLAELLKTPRLGIVSTLRFYFSNGINVPLNIIQYDLPKFQKTSITVQKGKAQSDIIIPVTFNGTKLATIVLLDEKTKKPVREKYFWTNCIDLVRHFDYDENGIILKKEILNELKSDSIFIFQFWPENVKVEVKAKVLE